MEIYELKDKDGRVYAFEVKNIAIGRMGALRIVRTIPGVVINRSPRNRFLSWGDPDEFCEFEIEGQLYVIDEPYGDNSRFWIGPKSESNNDHIDTVRKVFENYKPSILTILRRFIFEN